MVRTIMGLKGSGKTKQLIHLANEAIELEKGSVVCIEKGRKFTFDVSRLARRIDAGEYAVSGFEWLKGFISGLYAGNYDITHFFVDSLYKIAGSENVDDIDSFFKWLEEFSEANEVSFTITISAPVETAPSSVTKFLVSP